MFCFERLMVVRNWLTNLQAIMQLIIQLKRNKSGKKYWFDLCFDTELK